MYRIIHLDMARKYFTAEQVCGLMEKARACGFNQMQLYFSDNQGFRFVLDDMRAEVGEKTYDLSVALGDGYTDDELDMRPDGSGAFLTEQDMIAILRRAEELEMEIVPAFNMPGHMGAILQHFPQFRYRNGERISRSSLRVTNEEAVAFGLGILKRYVDFFAVQKCRFFNLFADEYAMDAGGMEALVASGSYPALMTFIRSAIRIIKEKGMTARVFNDALYYDGTEESCVDQDVEVCYWLPVRATAAEIAAHGHAVINASTKAFWVEGKTDWQMLPQNATTFEDTLFAGDEQLDTSAGSMLSLWCDRADLHDVQTVLNDFEPVMRVFGTRQ